MAQHSQVTEAGDLRQNVLRGRREAIIFLLSVSGFAALEGPSQALSAPESQPSSLSDVTSVVCEWD